MNNKITPDHLGRIAVVYVRQSTVAQGKRPVITALLCSGRM